MQRRQLIIAFVAAMFMASCGGSDTSDEELIGHHDVAINGPAEVEEGSRVSFDLENVTSDLEVKVSTGYVLSHSNTKLEVVVPTIGRDESGSLQIEVYAGAERVAIHNTEIIALAAPTLTKLPRPYPLESSRISKYDNVIRDENGVPMLERNGDLYYYHVDLSKIAQVYYAYVQKHNFPPKETAEFVAMAEWLRDNCVYTEWGFCSWRAQFDIPAYSLPDDWTSAMAQGQAITVLLYAYAVTQDESYIEVLSDAIAAFNYPISEKGVVADFSGNRFYEEYGSEDKPAHVLNGFLFALAGLHEVAELAGSQTAKQAFEQGVESLKQTLHFFDLGFTSRYDYSHLDQIASTKGGGNGDLYHEIHIAQLALIYQITNDEIIKEYLEKFLMYDTGGLTSFNDLKAASTKILDVEVSSSISPDTHGPRYLNDSNWTWRRYWSSSQVPSEVKLTLNNGSQGVAPTILRGLRLSALGEKTLPAELMLYDCAGESRKLLIKDVMQENKLADFSYDVNGYKSYTVVYDLSNVELECADIVLEITPNQELGFVALREINVHLQQPIIIEKLLERYKSYAN